MPEPQSPRSESRELAGSDTPGNTESPLLTANLRGTLFQLALPVLLQQVFSFGVAFTDTYLSGRISADATAAIGMAAYVGWLASLLFGLVGSGTMALVSRHWGANEVAEANRVTNTSMVLGAVLGLVATVAVYFGVDVLIPFLDLPGDAAAIATRYLKIDAFGLFFTALALTGAAALRGAGDMKTPMKVLGLMNIINIVVSSTLVFGLFTPLGIPKLGVDGIVAGTLAARVSSGVLMVWVLFRGTGGLQVSLEDMKPHQPTIKRILDIGVPAAAEGAVMWLGQFCFLMIIARLNVKSPSAAMAAHIVAVQIEAISYLPAVAYGQAAATMIGQSLGAGKPDRAIRAGHEAVKQCALPGLLLTVVFYFGANFIYQFMSTDADVAAVGPPAFRILSFFQVPLMALIVYTYSLRGAGDTRYPFVFMLIGMAGLRLPLAWLFGIYLGGGLVGAWIGMFADIILRGAMITYRYTRGRWVETAV